MDALTPAVRFDPEAGHGANAGLGWARDTLEPIRKNHPGISYADLYQLVGGDDLPALCHAFALRRSRSAPLFNRLT